MISGALPLNVGLYFRHMAAPKRELFKAAEVCDIVQVPTYVLRSWEAEFPQLGTASTSGARVYRRTDIEVVLRIKQLVFDEGLTLSGARRRLEEEGDQKNGGPILVEQVLGDHIRDRIKNVRTGLQSILQILSKDGEHQPELRLIAPTPPAAAKKKTAAKAKSKK
jgi:DNA-binding transcriptional MerR regulator